MFEFARKMKFQVFDKNVIFSRTRMVSRGVFRVEEFIAMIGSLLQFDWKPVGRFCTMKSTKNATYAHLPRK